MRRWITGFINLTLILCLSTTVFAKTPIDIKGHWAEKQIQTVYDMGILSDLALDKFEPNQKVMRAEFCAVINRAFGFTSEAAVKFSDVKSSDWYASDIKKAVAAGYVNADNKTARATENISRAEVATMLNRILKFEDTTSHKKFNDAKTIPAWAKESINGCVNSGIFRGDDRGNFRPADELTRAELVIVIMSVIEQP